MGNSQISTKWHGSDKAENHPPAQESSKMEQAACAAEGTCGRTSDVEAL